MYILDLAIYKKVCSNTKKVFKNIVRKYLPVITIRFITFLIYFFPKNNT